MVNPAQRNDHTNLLPILAGGAQCLRYKPTGGLREVLPRCYPAGCSLSIEDCLGWNELGSTLSLACFHEPNVGLMPTPPRQTVLAAVGLLRRPRRIMAEVLEVKRQPVMALVVERTLTMGRRGSLLSS